MAASYKESKIYACSAQEIMTELSFPRTHSMLGVSQKGVQPWLMQYQFTKSVSLTSWGEKINIKLTPIGENQTSVEVHSECALPTQVIDWGKNKENVRGIFYQLDSLLLQYIKKNVAAPQPVPAAAAQQANAAEQSAPQQPQPAAQNAAPMTPGAYGIHCTSCGMPLPSAANFCSRCGTPVVRP